MTGARRLAVVGVSDPGMGGDSPGARGSEFRYNRGDRFSSVGGRTENLGGFNVEGVNIDAVLTALRQTYEARGWSYQLFKGDKMLIRRLGCHPQDATIDDLHRVIAGVKSTATKNSYTNRFRSIYRTLRKIGIVTTTVDEQLESVRKPRTVPRPIQPEEALMLMTEAPLPYRHWFILGCRAGMRAMEVSNARGEHLIDLGGGRYQLRIIGKGHTDLVVPVHPDVAAVFNEYPSRGRLWGGTATRISRYGSAMMREMGIPEARGKFHCCRHYFATTVLEASGWDLLSTSRLMRHATVNTTVGYTALRQDRLEEILEAI